MPVILLNNIDSSSASPVMILDAACCSVTVLNNSLIEALPKEEPTELSPDTPIVLSAVSHGACGGVTMMSDDGM